MNRVFRDRKFPVTLVLALCLGALGCKGNGDALDGSSGSSSGSSASGVTTVGTVSSTGFYVNATFSTGGTPNPLVNYYFHEQSSPPVQMSSATTTPQCLITTANFAPFGSAPSSAADIFCILDVGEEDLYMNDLVLNMNAPAGVCNYVISMPYSAYAFQPMRYGNNLAVTITVDETAGNTISYNWTNPAVGVQATNGQGLFNQALLPGLKGGSSATGNVDCTANYTSIGGPNACEGKINIEPCTISTTGTTCAVAPTLTDLGGSAVSALKGPGVDLNPKDPVSGFPVPLVYPALGTGQNIAYTVAAPTHTPRGSNLYVANFWNPADIQAGTPGNPFFPPAFLRGDLSATGPAINTNLPNALLYTTDPLNLFAFTKALSGGVAGFLPQNGPAGAQTVNTVGVASPGSLNPYYMMGCLDAAGDYKARIRILIRSWDTVTGWTQFTNPYTGGGATEPTFLDPVHDWITWTDMPTTYPQRGF